MMAAISADAIVSPSGAKSPCRSSCRGMQFRIRYQQSIGNRGSFLSAASRLKLQPTSNTVNAVNFADGGHHAWETVVQWRKCSLPRCGSPRNMRISFNVARRWRLPPAAFSHGKL